ncbi:MAG: PcfJ domain-containing protein [Lacrimispora saccharolytica]
MKRRKLLNTQPCQEPEKVVPDAVTAVSQLVEVDGKIILNIDLFTGAGLQARYFADKEAGEYESWVAGKWSGAIIQNVARKCMGMQMESYWFGLEPVEWAEEKDQKRAKKYLEERLDWWQERIGSRRYQKKLNRQKDRVQEIMDQVPCVPEEMERWIREKVFPEEYLFFRKGEKTYSYHCTACGCHGRKKNGWKHNEMTVCPRCGCRLQAKSRTQRIEKKDFVYLLQRFGEQGSYLKPGTWMPVTGELQWIEREFTVICVWEDGKKELCLNEEIRCVIDNGKTWGKVYYGQLYNADEFEQDWWNTNPLNKRFRTGWLYPETLPEVLPAAGLEKSGLKELAEKERLNVNFFIVRSRERSYMEYLVKSGFTRLAAEITNDYGIYGEPEEFRGEITGPENLKLNGDRRNRLKQMNGGVTAWRWLEYEQKTSRKISQEALEWLQEKNVTSSECTALLQELGSVNRMVNYMKKQRVAPGRIIEVWRDYLRMARDEGMDTGDDIIRFPKDLKRRHDELVERITQRQNAEKEEQEKKRYQELNRKIAGHMEQAGRYYFQTDDYLIIPARKCEELNEEGRILHHCVGASGMYKERMAQGISWILFLRHTETADKPYYTIEIDMKTDEIMQAYSEYDRKPDWEQVSKILTKFKNHLRGIKQKTA